MDATTAEVRYKRWIQVIEDWNNSGLSKKVYCQQYGIDEKQFYYYQRRIRTIIAAQNARSALPENSSDVAESSLGQQTNQPSIVKLLLSTTDQTNDTAISFSVNGMNLSVSEDIPTPFLAKLLEAANHGSR